MAFTYDGHLYEDFDLVRFWLDDTTEGKGPRPANANFSDAEINGLLALEDSWRLAVAAGYEVLASAYADKTSYSVVNGSFTKSDASRQYLALAKEWRAKYGESATAPQRPGSISVTKSDYGLEPREALT